MRFILFVTKCDILIVNLPIGDLSLWYQLRLRINIAHATSTLQGSLTLEIVNLFIDLSQLLILLILFELK